MILLAVVGVALALAVATDHVALASPSHTAGGGQEGEEKTKKEALPVGVAIVTTGTMEHYLMASTTVESQRSVQVVARGDGFVTEVFVDEGDAVRQGQPLAQLDRRELSVALRKAELSVANLKRALERSQELKRSKLLTGSEFEKAQLNYEVALADREAAAIALSNATLQAPFAGRITFRAVEVGQQVKPGQHLFTAEDFDPLIAHIHVPARDADAMHDGQEVRFELEAGKSGGEPQQFLGTVARVSPVVSQDTGTVKVRLNLTAPPASVKPGTFLKVQILDGVRTGALVVSKKALVYDASSPYIFRTNGETVDKVPVALGLDDGSDVEIVSGLSEGDQVVIVGKEGLKDGASVKIVS